MNCIRKILNRGFIVEHNSGEETKEGERKNDSFGVLPSFSCHVSHCQVRENF